MVPYVSRIPVEDEYKQALGQVYYNFAAASWQLVYLLSLHSDGYVSLASDQSSAILARDFKVIAAASKDTKLVDLAARYEAAVTQRNALMSSVGITYASGEQILSGSGTPWTIDRLNEFAQTMEAIDIEANKLYYGQKSS